MSVVQTKIKLSLSASKSLAQRFELTPQYTKAIATVHKALSKREKNKEAPAALANLPMCSSNPRY